MNKKIFWIVIILALIVFGVLAVSGDDNESTNPANIESLTLSDIHGLEVDINDPNRLYLPNHQGLYVQGADGNVSKISEISDDLMSFDVSPAESNVLYASGHPRTGGNLGLIKSTDSGVTWQSVSEGLNGPVDFHTMAIDSKEGNQIYGYYAGALQRSLDGGKTWGYLNDAPAQIIQLSSGATEDQLYAATTDGLHVSNDRGESWTVFAFEGETVIAVEVNPNSNQIIASTNAQGLVLSDDGGETWSNSDFGATDTVLYIASSPSEPSKSYLITRSLKIYQSTDSGSNWELR
ncbi:MAG: hypothetical protein WD432_03375 [Candidatus Saccharimonadales bacterium]